MKTRSFKKQGYGRFGRVRSLSLSIIPGENPCCTRILESNETNETNDFLTPAEMMESINDWETRNDYNDFSKLTRKPMETIPKWQIISPEDLLKVNFSDPLKALIRKDSSTTSLDNPHTRKKATTLLEPMETVLLDFRQLEMNSLFGVVENKRETTILPTHKYSDVGVKTRILQTPEKIEDKTIVLNKAVVRTPKLAPTERLDRKLIAGTEILTKPPQKPAENKTVELSGSKQTTIMEQARNTEIEIEIETEMEMEMEMEQEVKKSVDTQIIPAETNIMSAETNIMSDEEQVQGRTLPVGTILQNRYKIVKLISEKFDRATYKVEDMELRNLVSENNGTGNERYFILKEIFTPKMSNEELWSRRSIFNDNVHIISTLRHDNLSEIYRCFSENDRDYYLMERIDGVDLEALSIMSAKPFSEKEVVNWGMELASALQFLHHRPIPFSLEGLEPASIMVDQKGTLKITNYNLERIFDLRKNPRLGITEPNQQYTDITRLARVLYFLLTKNRYDESTGVRLSQGMSVKMMSLLDITCREGQRAYGDVRVFRRKLELTQMQEKEEIKTVKSRYGFHDITPDFSWLKRIWTGVLNQKPYMIVVELMFIITFLFLVFAHPFEERAYARPVSSPLSYVFTDDEIFTINASTFEIIDEKQVSLAAGDLISTNSIVRDKYGRILYDGELLLVSDRIKNQLHLINMETNDIVKSLNINAEPSMFIKNEENDSIWIFHENTPKITIVDHKFLSVKNTINLDYVPKHALKIPGKTDFKVIANKLQGIVVACENRNELVSIRPSTGTPTGTLRLDYTPGPMIMIPQTDRIASLDQNNSSLVFIATGGAGVVSKTALPREHGKPADLVYDSKNRLIWISFPDSHSLVSYSLYENKFGKQIKAIGKTPTKLVYRENAEQLWVLCEGSKEIVIIDTMKNTTAGRVVLGKRPVKLGLIEK
jgi:hypothetical protein